ncbi:MAG: hypothetical protein GF364_16815 [Candidatus Lokiarchaeota archaeon]|nr:hypothetical protein [Candidatus Lokiarchaeota archaeon]
MATKPYISSSNYLLKMSDFPKGKWCKIFDALYWNFIENQKEKLQENPRMRLMLNILEKKGKEEIEELTTTAREFMQEFE